MTRSPLFGRRALVTGASSGLGVDFARVLAAHGCSLVLVARREAEMQALAAEIRGANAVDVEVVPADLGDPATPGRLFYDLSSRGLAVDVLVNNAGFGLFGPFSTIPWEREAAMLDLDVVRLTHLTKLFLPGMLERRAGWILQVASIGAFQPSPTYATYSAAKAYVLSFGEALDWELRGTGVSCTTICPGITRTAFLDVAGQRATPYQRAAMMESADVARIGVEAMVRRRPSVTPGLLNASMAFSVRFLPRRLQAAVAALLMRED